MISDRERQGRYQSDFYRENYHKLLNALILSCVIVVMLIAAIIYFILQHHEPTYYATTLGGSIISMTPHAL
jgi:hypothetical protein